MPLAEESKQEIRDCVREEVNARHVEMEHRLRRANRLTIALGIVALAATGVCVYATARMLGHEERLLPEQQVLALVDEIKAGTVFGIKQAADKAGEDAADQMREMRATSEAKTVAAVREAAASEVEESRKLIRAELHTASIEELRPAIEDVRARLAKTNARDLAQPPVPVGSIAAFYGSAQDMEADQAWLVCDGRPVPADSPLRTAMGMDRTPDLRGMFLRGAGQNSNADFSYKGAEEYKAGDRQGDTLKQHWHQSIYLGSPGGGVALGHSISTHEAPTRGIDTTLAITERVYPPVFHDWDETRPKNAAVVWIIKAY